jgi:hypothetical protein
MRILTAVESDRVVSNLSGEILFSLSLNEQQDPDRVSSLLSLVTFRKRDSLHLLEKLLFLIRVWFQQNKSNPFIEPVLRDRGISRISYWLGYSLDDLISFKFYLFSHAHAVYTLFR